MDKKKVARVAPPGGAFRGFYPDTFAFLRALALNNERAWFEERKADYEGLVLEPALALIRAMEPVIKGLSPHYAAVAKRVGGSLMRIYRDTRFGADKTPYKTNIGIQFRHEAYKDVHAPGFYVHLEPDSCFVGAGCWRPEKEALAAIRERVAAKPKPYLAAIEAARGEMEVAGDSLVRVPRGFDTGHPMAEELKRVDFLLSADLEPKLYLDGGLVDVLARKFGAASAYMKYLCAALGAAY